jgi:bacterioferritin-associated ferredoxin
MSKLTNSQRIRNILDGKVTDNTKIIAGYKKSKEDHIEGDCWEEDGKQWQIKNGIKQSVTKLDDVRKLILMPILCPKCHRPMKKHLDKKFWNMRGMCMDCVIEEDNERIENGTFKEYSKQVIQQNINAFTKDIKEEVRSYIDSYGAKHFVTEQGDVEEWIGKQNKKEVEKIMNEKLEKLENIVQEKFGDNK